MSVRTWGQKSEDRAWGLEQNQGDKEEKKQEEEESDPKSEWTGVSEEEDTRLIKEYITEVRNQSLQDIEQKVEFLDEDVERSEGVFQDLSPIELEEKTNVSEEHDMIF